MTNMVWLILILGYGFFTWAAGKRSFATAVLCFLDGFYLAMQCFAILPRAMETEHFYGAAAVAAIGVTAGLWLEKKEKDILPVLVFAITTGCYSFWAGGLSLREVLFLAFFGGMGLYHASAGIIPDKIEIGKALLSAAGFLLGTFLFVGF